MDYKKELLKYLHKIYRKDNFINYFLEAVKKIINDLNNEIKRFENLLHFNRLDLQSCEWWENLLGITTKLSTIQDRQSYIRSKWRMSNHNSIDLIKNICASFENGTVEATFENGDLKLEFGQNSNISLNINTLLDLINEVKPAHIQYLLKYVLKFKTQIHSGVGISEEIKSEYDCRNKLTV